MHKGLKRVLMLMFMVLGVFLVYRYVEHRFVQERRKVARIQQEQKRNIYIITASGLRPDHLSSYSYQPIQTPAIDFLAGDGVQFEHAYTTSSESLPAHFSILTGSYPFRTPVKESLDFLLEFSSKKPPENMVTMPGWFRKMGYHTGAFLSDPELRFPSFFMNFFDEVASGDHPLSFWEESYDIADVCRTAREWILGHRTKPHFVLLNFNEPTRPFQPPEPFDKHYAKHPYDGETAALDEQIGLFMNLLKSSGLFNRSVVVFTSPYGESLNGESRFGSLKETTIHVPLLIAAPGILPRRQVYKSQVSLVDLFPTVLALLESKAGMKFDGVPVFQKGTAVEITREFIFGETRVSRRFGFPAQHFVRNSKWKLVSGEKEQFFSNSSEDLPTEVTPENKHILQSMEEQLQENRLPRVVSVRTKLDAEPASLSDAVRRCLQDGRPKIAFDLLQSFEKELPASPCTFHLLGELAEAAGDSEKALHYSQKAYALSANSQLLQRLARAHTLNGHFQDARTLQDKYMKTAKFQDYHSYTTNGFILHNLNENVIAVRQLDHAIVQNPRYSDAYLYRGMAYAQLGDRVKAELDLKKAIDTNPTGEVAYRRLAQLLQEGPSKENALPYLRKLLEFNPRDFASMLQLARLHEETGNREEAIKLCREIILYAEDPQLKNEAKAVIAR